jgi:N-acetylglucosaminyl-diphospho-decaprenol L-rhamnosyltransferase
MTAFTLLVVVHDSAAELRALLDSIQRHLVPRPPLVVVDSGSRDGGAGAALARERGAEVVVLDGSPGFGAANNAGLGRVRTPVTVLLNPDAELLDASLLALADRAGARDALVVPRLLNAGGSVQKTAHPVPGSAAGMLLPIAPLLPGSLRAVAEPWRAGAPRDVGWAVAAALAARTDTLRRLGPFDPGAFLHYEDLDLCLRARAAGIPTELRPGVVLRHAGGHAVNRAGEPLAAQARRRRRVVGAVLGGRALARDDAAQALTFATRALAHRDGTRERAQLRALRAARRG